ncbi:MAG: integrase arm-type DNA-binding domain-containing protein [Rhizobiaceae bacterium]
MALTDARLRTLKTKEKPYKVADYDGLYVLVNKSGSLLWRFKYRILGKEKLLSFGKYPQISLAQARTARDEARATIASGNDPSAKKQEEVAAAKFGKNCTFAKVAEQYLSKIIKEGRAESTLAKLDWLMGMANAGLGTKPIAEITAPTILAVLRKEENKGNYETALRLRSTIGAVFRYAIANGLAENDPTFALRDALVTPKVTPRAAITDKKALGGLMRAIDGFEGQTSTRIALELLAIVVTRPGELRHSKWTEIDLEKAVWTIPAERMKMRATHTVPLPDRALELLNELSDLNGWAEYLFPSIRSPKRPMSENTLNAGLRRMGFSGDEMTSHGFRATFSTIANESGLWNPDAIERALAHVETNKIRAAYARGAYWDERVKIADWWSGLLNELRCR